MWLKKVSQHCLFFLIISSKVSIRKKGFFTTDKAKTVEPLEIMHDKLELSTDMVQLLKLSWTKIVRCKINLIWLISRNIPTLQGTWGSETLPYTDSSVVIMSRFNTTGCLIKFAKNTIFALILIFLRQIILKGIFRVLLCQNLTVRLHSAMVRGNCYSSIFKSKCPLK